MPTEEQCQLHTQQILEIEKRQIKMEGDVTHIRDRIDNGMSSTIQDVKTKMDDLALVIAGKIMPTIKDSEFWVGKIKIGIFGIFMTSICGGIVWISIHLIRQKIGG